MAFSEIAFQGKALWFNAVSMGLFQRFFRGASTRSSNRAAAAEAVARRATQQLREIRAKYDAAETSSDNRRHWCAADALSANAANSPDVRRTLRNRARYELANNSYAAGIALTIANDAIGTGPRLQVTTSDQKANGTLEYLFAQWAEAIDLAGKLRTMRVAKLGDGEAFAQMMTNPALSFPVQVDLRLLEADQVATPYPTLALDEIDGIRFDQFGNAIEYRVLATHPGDTRTLSALGSTTVPATAMLHYFRVVRPGQMRGIPEITAALPLFAQLRRYTLAVIAAAETAADLALVIQSDAPPSDEEGGIPEMSTWELEKRMATVLPQGWQLGQAKPEQPTTTYEMFKREILNEIARCLNVPYNVAACNSSSYNYASGRLDHQIYFRSTRIEQSIIQRVILDRLFTEFLSEATLIEGLLPQSLRRIGLIVPHQWFWDGNEHVDPEKEANAENVRLKNYTTTLSEAYGRRGQDWEEQLAQRAIEYERMKVLGLPDPNAEQIVTDNANQPAAGAPNG